MIQLRCLCGTSRTPSGHGQSPAFWSMRFLSPTWGSLFCFHPTTCQDNFPRNHVLCAPLPSFITAVVIATAPKWNKLCFSYTFELVRLFQIKNNTSASVWGHVFAKNAATWAHSSLMGRRDWFTFSGKLKITADQARNGQVRRDRLLTTRCVTSVLSL